jgi:hypothetical protein
MTLFLVVTCFTSINNTAGEFLTGINDTGKAMFHQCPLRIVNDVLSDTEPIRYQNCQIQVSVPLPVQILK